MGSLFERAGISLSREIGRGIDLGVLGRDTSVGRGLGGGRGDWVVGVECRDVVMILLCQDFGAAEPPLFRSRPESPLDRVLRRGLGLDV